MARRSSESGPEGYLAFLTRKVELARDSIRRGEGASNEAVEAEFAARRAKVKSGQISDAG